MIDYLNQLLQHAIRVWSVSPVNGYLHHFIECEFVNTFVVAAIGRAALQQQSILVNMLNALIKAENDLNNIREIVWVEQGGGEQFHASQGQTHASVGIIKVHGIDGSTN